MSTTRLSQLRLDTPCSMPWDEMRFVSGDGSVRYCSHCALNVTDLSSMEADEAEAFVARRNGERTCVRFYRDANANVLTLDYQGNPAFRWKWPVVAATAVAMVAGGAATYHGANTGLRRAIAGTTCTMGDMVSPATAYSSFNAAANPFAAAQTRLIPTQMSTDVSLRPIATSLPSGVAVIDLQYGVYPAQFTQSFGRCIAVGAPDEVARLAGKVDTANVRAIIWLLPLGYSGSQNFLQPNEPHPLRFAGLSGESEILIWSDDAELERTILAGLLSPSSTTAMHSDSTTLPAD